MEWKVPNNFQRVPRSVSGTCSVAAEHYRGRALYRYRFDFTLCFSHIFYQSNLIMSGNDKRF